MKLLVTGGTGFVGRHLLQQLVSEGHTVRALTRRTTPQLASLARCYVAHGLEDRPVLAAAMSGIDCVVHLAAHDHSMGERLSPTAEQFFRINADGTEHLAREAATAGVRRFILMSSIKAVAEYGAEAFDETSECRPETPYGKSKLEAERRLQVIARASGMESVVLRPPLIYGPGVGKSFLRLIEAVRRKRPLPVGALPAQRSLLAIDNLLDVLVRAIAEPSMAGQLYHIADDERFSTPELAALLAEAIGVPKRLAPVPPLALRIAGRLTGKSQEINRLIGGLTVSTNKLKRDIDWQPVVAAPDAIRATVAARLAELRSAA